MDAPCKIQGNIHVLLCLIHKINVSRILGTYHDEGNPFIFLLYSSAVIIPLDFGTIKIFTGCFLKQGIKNHKYKHSD